MLHLLRKSYIIQIAVIYKDEFLFFSAKENSCEICDRKPVRHNDAGTTYQLPEWGSLDPGLPGWGLCRFSSLAFSFPMHQGKTGFLKSCVSWSFHFREQEIIITISFSFDQKLQQKITCSKILLQRVLWFLLWLSLCLKVSISKVSDLVHFLGDPCLGDILHTQQYTWEISSPFPEAVAYDSAFITDCAVLRLKSWSD